MALKRVSTELTFWHAAEYGILCGINFNSVELLRILRDFHSTIPRNSKKISGISCLFVSYRMPYLPSLHPVFRIQIRIGSGLNLNWVSGSRSKNPDPHPGSSKRFLALQLCRWQATVSLSSILKWVSSFIG